MKFFNQQDGDDNLKKEQKSFEVINNTISNENISYLKFTAERTISGDGYVVNGDPENKNSKKDISLIYIENIIQNRLEINSFSISQLFINELGDGGRVALKLVNCDIAILNIYVHKERNRRINLILENTRIGELNLQSNTIEYFHVKGGCILNLTCNPPNEPNPFIGSVSFENVFFPRNTKNFPLKDPQPYRNMRHHMSELENHQMANLFHSLELAIEREKDVLTNKIFGYLYEWVSDYGASTLRPILWLILFYVISVYMAYTEYGVSLAYDKSLYKGSWRAILIEPHEIGMVSRAFVYSIQPILNPLGIFGVRSLLVPGNGYLFVWSLLQSIFSVTFVALTIFALRRRFKISQ